MKDFFLLDKTVQHTSVTRTKIGSSSADFGDFFDALFDNGNIKTEDYYAVRRLSNGYTVKYYLTKFYEIYRSNWWSISIYFNDDITKQFNRIADACNWNTVFTKDSLKYAFRKFPYIYNAIISRENIDKNSSYTVCTFLYDRAPLTKYIHEDYLSEYKENEAVEELCNTALGMLRELVTFKLDISELVRNPIIPKSSNNLLPSWLRDGINVAVRIGAKSLAAYIGANIDSNFDIGNVNTDFDGDFDFDGDSDFCGDLGDNSIPFLGGSTPSFDSGKDVHIVCETGTDKGYFDVYLKDGKKYIKFGNGSRSDWSNWVLIQGKMSFVWRGNRYYIK